MPEIAIGSKWRDGSHTLEVMDLTNDKAHIRHSAVGDQWVLLDHFEEYTPWEPTKEELEDAGQERLL